MENPLIKELRSTAEEAVRPILEDDEEILAIIADCRVDSLQSKGETIVVTNQRLLVMVRPFFRPLKVKSITEISFDAWRLVRWEPDGGLWEKMHVVNAAGGASVLNIGRPDVEGGHALAAKLAPA